MIGILYGIGIGPGDPELMTIKAVRLIKSCSVIAIPRSGDGERVALSIAAQAVPELSEKHIIELEMPMTRDKEMLRRSHEAAASTIISYLSNGLDVAFLTLGDPTVYATYIYVHRIVKDRGYQTKIVPGVPSFCAVAAKLGDCLVETSQSLHIIPGSYGTLEDALILNGTKVLMKCGKSFPQIRERLRVLGLSGQTKMIENCGLANERVHDTLDTADDNAGYFSVIVIKDTKQ